MGRAGIDQYVYLLDEAFEGTAWHSVMSNVSELRPEDWLWLPPAGGRPIGEMVAHLGACKYMYENHAFGDATLTWDDMLVDERRLKSTTPQALEELLGWLREAHQRVRDSVSNLADDSELLQERQTNWGEMAETRWIIKTVIEHDVYHAGEINHIRALRQGTDRWAYADAY
jgi:uncharacterized damage-inducible protein DinB